MPAYIILHYTGMSSEKAALDRLCSKDSGVSAHYTIGEDGQVYQHVATEKRAWHAGKSFWRGMTDMNSASIGIEIVNPGHEHGYRPFQGKQIESLLSLLNQSRRRLFYRCAEYYRTFRYSPFTKRRPGRVVSMGAIGRKRVRSLATTDRRRL